MDCAINELCYNGTILHGKTFGIHLSISIRANVQL